MLFNRPPENRKARFGWEAGEIELEDSSVKESDDRAGPPKVEQERLDTEEEVTSAISSALALARERFGRALGVSIDG